MTWKRRTPSSNRRRRHRRELGYISYSAWKQRGPFAEPQSPEFRRNVARLLAHFKIKPRSYWRDCYGRVSRGERQRWSLRIVF
jgi:hypothetical protein